VRKRVGFTYSEPSRIAPYIEALEAAGLDVLPIAPGYANGLEGIEGLVLSGGLDLNPALYGQSPHPEAEVPNDARDETELVLLRMALKADLPVLAICRGMQLFNVAAGGTLHQHIDQCATHRRYDLEKRIPVHEVEVASGTHLAAILGDGPAMVNSRHHQAVAQVGAGLTVSAVAPDGVVEGIEMPGKRFAVAVQWHPEDQAPHDPIQAKLFTAFANSV
jgi:putative glutamine amidotransferase